MSWSFVFLMVIACSLIVGPIMMMRPSPEQKKREGLRLLARSLGLEFTQRKLPQVAGDIEPSALAIAVYFVAPSTQNFHEDWLLLRANYEHELHLLGYWTWAGEQRASASEIQLLSEYLRHCPQSIKAVSGGRSGYSIYWSEKGDDEEVRGMATFLNGLQKASAQ